MGYQSARFEPITGKPLLAGLSDLDTKPTEKLKHIIRVCRQAFVGVGVFSAAINLLMLAVPIYMLQVYDRVLTTRNVDTLLALTVMVGGPYWCWRCWNPCVVGL